jgi:D-arabinose 1-dehydrogenase-like Zn-dependent alcohol dehydrogenase
MSSLGRWLQGRHNAKPAVPHRASIRSMIEVFPLAQVQGALERTRTGQARFRTVLLPGQ